MYIRLRTHYTNYNTTTTRRIGIIVIAFPECFDNTSSHNDFDLVSGHEHISDTVNSTP